MHSYDAMRPQSYQSHIPAMRPAHAREVHGSSHTPIYDALCSEYQRAFRALPGDRSGEEDLGFAGFGALTTGGLSGGYGDPWQSWTWVADRPAEPSWQVPSYAGHGGHQPAAPGYGGGRPHHTGTHVPAALPPAPRRGF
ncbi:hypothetical protein [Streptomyces sp. NPDC089919]|uniref:hypothetical protein n=1 Tax=Streptomyces sp. NPDC089919 TaxID=3155188 RepID=UPI0034358A1B